MANNRDIVAVAAMPMANESILWQAAHGGDSMARERLIEAYLPFARIMAAKLFAGRTDNDLEFAEYLQFATIGLIESVDRFDYGRDVQFKTFAGHRITGAVLNGIEHLSEKREQISAFGRSLAEHREATNPTDDNDEQALFQKLADIAIGLALGHMLGDAANSGSDEPTVSENQYAGIELKQLRERIHALVNRLPQRERMVIKCHYLNHIPFSTIAENLGVTRGRVSQVHKNALDRLREMIKSVKACDVAW